MTETGYNFHIVERHVYDIDVFEIFDNLRDKYKANVALLPKELKDLCFIDESEKIFTDFMSKNGIDLTNNIIHRNYILPSSYNNYVEFLVLKILTMDPYKIGPLLSYQSELYLGNYYATKDNFVGLVEFMVYNGVKSRNFLKEDIRLERIVNWVEHNRVFLLQRAYTNKTVSMEPTFANLLYQKLQAYFFEEQHNSLYELIFSNAKPVELLQFHGTVIELSDLFKRLRYNNLINVDKIGTLAKWISGNFCLKNDDNLQTPVPLNNAVVLDYLSRESRIPKRPVRLICEDIAPYLSKESRKSPRLK
jgi:hypothetical protein